MEVAGIEPASENPSAKTSPITAVYFPLTSAQTVARLRISYRVFPVRYAKRHA